ncbi:hypothetical protein PGT21_004230 [Puccinia graminis f. sp. tritici]|uniref:Uncharacterized protein n=1 Tax=Puccinia graminis f. sp. tritici TaxID=56615 RepID=A0A5B0QXC4_PUCGR|nr:hypothetical protein PGT21_004230 [Puccinia graminis f. sp. tritici]
MRLLEGISLADGTAEENQTSRHSHHEASMPWKLLNRRLASPSTSYLSTVSPAVMKRHLPLRDTTEDEPDAPAGGLCANGFPRTHPKND